MAGCGGCRHGRLWRLQAWQAVAAAGRPGCGGCRQTRLWRLQAWQAVAAAGIAGCGGCRHGRLWWLQACRYGGCGSCRRGKVAAAVEPVEVKIHVVNNVFTQCQLS